MKTLLLILVLLIIGGVVWIRFAPSDPVIWHTNPADPALTPGAGRFLACRGGDQPAVPGDAETLARLDTIAMETPRTIRLSGSPDEGRITWVTRSRVMGFPDFTTAGLTPDGDAICIHARLRFGRDDFGVNRARVTNWLTKLAQSEPD